MTIRSKIGRNEHSEKPRLSYNDPVVGSFLAAAQPSFVKHSCWLSANLPRLCLGNLIDLTPLALFI